MEFQTSSRFMSFLSLLSHLYCGRPPSDKSILRRGDMEPQEYDEVRRTYRVGYTYFYHFLPVQRGCWKPAPCFWVGRGAGVVGRVKKRFKFLMSGERVIRTPIIAYYNTAAETYTVSGQQSQHVRRGTRRCWSRRRCRRRILKRTLKDLISLYSLWCYDVSREPVQILADWGYQVGYLLAWHPFWTMYVTMLVCGKGIVWEKGEMRNLDQHLRFGEELWFVSINGSLFLSNIQSSD